MTTPTSIESLLTWAYRDQMVHVALRDDDPPPRVRGAAVLRYKTLTDVYDLGTFVNSSQSVGFSAQRDAFVVHDAVRALPTIEAHLPAEVFAKCAASLHQSAMPAYAVDFLVPQAKIVMGCAIDGKRPDWIPEPMLILEKRAPVYQKTRSGQIKRDRFGNKIELMQIMQFVGDMPWEVETARIKYRLWVRALAALRVTLRPKLTNHEISDDLPAEEPWAQPIDGNGTLDIGSETFVASGARRTRR